MFSGVSRLNSIVGSSSSLPRKSVGGGESTTRFVMFERCLLFVLLVICLFSRLWSSVLFSVFSLLGSC